MHFAIVGAGPAGAALGFLLARAGGEVTLLERQTDFAREFRGEVLMPSGLDALVQMGLGEALAALPQREVSRIAIYQGARPLFVLPLATAARAVSQPALLEMLAHEAARHQHLAAKLAREVGLSLEQRDPRARAREQQAERRARGPGTDDREVHGERYARLLA